MYSPGYHICRLESFNKDPTQQDWIAVKRIFRYLKGTIHYKLTYCNSNPLVGYSDASYAPGIDRKSISGFIFLFNGGPVSWRSRKQNITATSSMESEFIALGDAVKEALWFRKLQTEFQLKTELIIYEDNQSTIKFSQNATHSDRTKHIDIRFYFIIEHLKLKHYALEYCPTTMMLADALTKPLGRILLSKHSLGMGLVSDYGGMLDNQSLIK